MITSVPVSWDTNDLSNLDYNIGSITTPELYKEAGHCMSSLQIHNYFEPNPMPEGVLDVKKYFNFLDHCTLAINMLAPGEYLPMHSDAYKAWMKVFNVTSVDRIFRAVIMVEDRKFGQFNEVGDEVISNWKAGDCISWLGTTRHSAYNFNTVPRYAIQLTGLIKSRY
ncbi:hypothetical protein N9A25_00345 [bacterium]|nr:hypothetical protein [bacterium]